MFFLINVLHALLCFSWCTWCAHSLAVSYVLSHSLKGHLKWSGLFPSQVLVHLVTSLWGSSWLYPPLLMWALILPIYMCMEGVDSLFMPPFLHFLRSAIVPAVSVALQMASVVGLVATVATIRPLGLVALVWVSPQTI